MSVQGTVSIDTIKRMSAAAIGVSLMDIVSARRDAKSVRARHIAMYLARQLTAHSLPAIGRNFGNRDHSTVAHAIGRIDRLMDTDPDVANEVTALWQVMLPARSGVVA